MQLESSENILILLLEYNQRKYIYMNQGGSGMITYVIMPEPPWFVYISWEIPIPLKTISFGSNL